VKVPFNTTHIKQRKTSKKKEEKGASPHGNFQEKQQGDPRVGGCYDHGYSSRLIM
jgi:hypothetical protein